MRKMQIPGALICLGFFLILTQCTKNQNNPIKEIKPVGNGNPSSLAQGQSAGGLFKSVFDQNAMTCQPGQCVDETGASCSLDAADPGDFILGTSTASSAQVASNISPKRTTSTADTGGSFPTECACSQIKVVCDATDEKPYAYGTPTCEIHISASDCATYSYTNGKSYGSGDFASKNQCKINPPPGGDVGNHIYNCCAIRHEYAHTCDSQWKKRQKMCMGCGEVYAENFEQKCSIDLTEYYCTNGRLNNTECLGKCHNLSFRTSNKIWDACMCAGLVAASQQGIPLPKDQCQRCYDQCRNSDKYSDLLPQFCIDHIKEWGDGHERKDSCDWITRDNGNHSCSYYGGDDKDVTPW